MTSADRSQLVRLRQSLLLAVREMERAQNQLDGIYPSFARLVDEVTDTVGGSSQKVDQQMVAALQAARSRTSAAVQTLASSRSAVSTFAMRL